ncbi:MAG: flagellar filament capping protein FliD [Lachnospiraceae bacterium]|nr:flagellar filament capping protein FliD [Lachnospiraceae bacterium]
MASPIRLTGMNSGLDTESIIKALTSTKKEKVTKLEGEQKRYSWKQDAWKKLNKKITDFYNGSLSSMRFSDAYSKKTTVLSDSSVASVVTSGSAMNTTQDLSVKKLATSAYQTGGELTTADGKAKGSTKISELGAFSATDFDASGNATIEMKVGGNELNPPITFNKDDTISSVVAKLKEAGVNANFDEGQGRLYIAGKDTGSEASFEITGGSGLAALGLSESYTDQTDAQGNRIAANGFRAGQDAEIELNGVTYKSKDGKFDINGLSITANKVGSTTLTTKNDTSGIYDMVKKFLKDYNELINEMSKLYNADNAKSYKMLTEEEKEAMSEDEVKDWEEKIKDGLLSGDSTLGDASKAMRAVMASNFEIQTANGTVKMNLSSFGINTQSYFNAPKDERNAFHIDGDKDSEISSVKSAEDKLGQWISSDPDAVTSFFTTLTKSLYTKLTDLMKGSQYSSSYTLYEDKLMNKQYSSYTDKIADANEKLTAEEDRYYKRFSKMETAMAKLNSTQSSLGSYFGMG